MSQPNEQQQQQQQQQPDGLMRISKAGKTETIRIQQFILENQGVALNEVMVEVDYNTSTFALAAMLKGLAEFYFKPGGQKIDPGMAQATEHNLKLWEEINQKAKEEPSRLILPK